MDIGAMNECAETRDRTGDLQIFGLALSQLSYCGHARVITPAVKPQSRRTKSRWHGQRNPQGTPHARHRGDSNPCGQSPTEFESISLTTRTQCQWRRTSKFVCFSHRRWALPRTHLQCGCAVHVKARFRTVLCGCFCLVVLRLGRDFAKPLHRIIFVAKHIAGPARPSPAQPSPKPQNGLGCCIA